MSISKMIMLYLVTLGSSVLSAQEIDWVSTDQGILFYADVHVNESSSVKIERREGRGYTYQGTIERAPSSEVFIQNYRKVEDLWTGYNHFDSLQLVERWHVLEKAEDLAPAIDQFEPTITLAFGLAVLAQNLEVGHSYEFRFTRDGGTDTTLTVQYQPDNFELNIENIAFDSDGPSPSLTWQCQLSRSLAGFRVFRAAAGSDHFTEITGTGGFSANGGQIALNVTDSSLSAEGFFDYYVTFLDTKGRTSNYSQRFAVHTFSPHDRPLLLTADITSVTSQKSIEMKWRYSRSALLRQIKIYRSEKLDQPFELIATLPPTDTSYIDPVEAALKNYYYFLIPVDYVGIMGQSPILTGNCKFVEKPLPPKKLIAHGDDHGVHLRWEPAGTNHRGYYVYRMTEDQALKQISAFVPRDSIMQFTDTTFSGLDIRTYGYAVRAESEGYMLGDFSDTAFVRPVIDLHIVPPTDISHRVDGPGVTHLHWQINQLDAEKISGFQIYRKAINEAEWILANRETIDKFTLHYADTTALSNLVYLYKVHAIDVFGRESGASRSHVVKLLDRPELRGPKYLKAKVLPDGIALRWADLSSSSLQSIKIFRKEKNQDFLEIGDQPISENYFLDATSQRGINYTYVVKGMLDQTITGPSEPVSVSR